MNASTAVLDVIVVGGGPVGLAAAIEARLAGLSVAIIEPRDSTIDKACGEGLMPGALPLLERLGMTPTGMPLRGVHYTDGVASAVHPFATAVGRGVRRTELHEALTARAEALGVTWITGRVTGLEQDHEGVTCTVRSAAVRANANGAQNRHRQSGHLQSGGTSETVSARWLLGCDGLHSSVRVLAGLDFPRSGRRLARLASPSQSPTTRTGARTARSRLGARASSSRRYGLRQHFAVAPWSEYIEVHWAKNVEAYVTPVSPGVVGIAMLGRQGFDFATELAAIPALAARLQGAAPASSLRGAGPLYQRARRPRAGRVLLVGDASGYVDAITGEGLRLGLAQARAAVASIAGGRPARYDREWRHISRDFRVLTTALVVAANSPLRRTIVPLSRALPTVFGAVVERLAR
jgi:flavin-dependent dehydrogenase